MLIKPFEWISVVSEDVETLPEWIEPTNNHLTLVKVGYVDAASLLPIPGANDEHLLFAHSATGRMSAEQWQSFLSSMQCGNLEPVLIIHDQRAFVFTKATTGSEPAQHWHYPSW